MKSRMKALQLTALSECKCFLLSFIICFVYDYVIVGLMQYRDACKEEKKNKSIVLQKCERLVELVQFIYRFVLNNLKYLTFFGSSVKLQVQLSSIFFCCFYRLLYTQIRESYVMYQRIYVEFFFFFDFNSSESKKMVFELMSNCRQPSIACTVPIIAWTDFNEISYILASTQDICSFFKLKIMSSCNS